MTHPRTFGFSISTNSSGFNGARLDLDADQRGPHRTVAEHRPRLLLLDPFVRLLRINENDAGEVSDILAYLRQLQRTFDPAVVVVHDSRKNGRPGAGTTIDALKKVSSGGCDLAVAVPAIVYDGEALGNYRVPSRPAGLC